MISAPALEPPAVASYLFADAAFGVMVGADAMAQVSALARAMCLVVVVRVGFSVQVATLGIAVTP